MNVDRAIVLDVISKEREYQINKWGDLDETNTIGDFLLYLKRELAKAEDSYRNPETYKDSKSIEALNGIRKVAATAVAAMERHGAPSRG